MDQPNPQLTAYIAAQLQAGQSPDEISAQLIHAKWPEDQVRQAFLSVQSQVLPTAMQSSPSTQAAAANQVSENKVIQAFGQRKGRIKTGWQLFKSSMKILNGNRYLFRFFIMTWVSVLVINAAIIAFAWFCNTSFLNSNAAWYPFVIIVYLVVYTIVNFYAAALASNIFDIYKGVRQPYKNYIKLAWKRIGPIFVYSFVAAIVGTLIEYIINSLGRIGQFIAWLIGATWSLTTMFSLPLIMDGKASGLGSIKQSAKLLKDNWGEGLTAKITVNGPLALLQMSLAFIFSNIIWGLIAVNLINLPLILFVVFFYVFIAVSISVLGSFANSIINVALYYYAVNKQIPPGFSEEMLSKVMVKGKRRPFSKKEEQTA